jgi:hypothetical protein
MLSILGSIISTVLGWFLGRKEAAGEKLGRAEQQVEDAKADIDVIHRANVAAKKQEERPNARDPNDLDR